MTTRNSGAATRPDNDNNRGGRHEHSEKFTGFIANFEGESVPGRKGDLNGWTQHQLEVQLGEPKTLKSFASVKSNKNTTLYRFNE